MKLTLALLAVAPFAAAWSSSSSAAASTYAVSTAAETSPYIPPVPPHPSCWASTVIPEAGATETIPIPINTCTMKSSYRATGYGTGYSTGAYATTGAYPSSSYTGPAIQTNAAALPTAAPALLAGALGIMALL